MDEWTQRTHPAPSGLTPAITPNSGTRNGLMLVRRGIEFAKRTIWREFRTMATANLKFVAADALILDRLEGKSIGVSNNVGQ